MHWRCQEVVTSIAWMNASVVPLENTLEHLIENLRWICIHRYPYTACIFVCSMYMRAPGIFVVFNSFIYHNEWNITIGWKTTWLQAFLLRVLWLTHTHTHRQRERYGTHLVYFRILSLSFSFIVFIDFSLHFLITRQRRLGHAIDMMKIPIKWKKPKGLEWTTHLIPNSVMQTTFTEFFQSASGMRANKTWHTDEKEM